MARKILTGKLDMAIICSAIPPRAPLLGRSIITWTRAIEFSKLDAKIYLYLEDKEGWDTSELNMGNVIGGVEVADKSGSHIAGYNYWLEERKIEADVYLFTHPDILFPKETVKVAYDLAEPDTFAAFKVFWMPEGMTNEIEKYNWRNPETLENEPDLFPPYFSDDHGDFYWNSDVRAKTEWHSTTTWAMDHSTVNKLRPFPDFKTQGPDDPYFATARALLKIKDHCIMNPILMHQHHPQTWNQDAKEATDLASKELKKRFGREDSSS